jgi:Ca2+/Na+ antiporter
MMASFSVIMNFTFVMTAFRRLSFIILAILLLGIAAVFFYTPDKPKSTEVTREPAERSVSTHRSDTAKTPPVAEGQFGLFLSLVIYLVIYASIF